MAGDPSADDCADEIRFLGSGDDAIIRPGVVLLAPNHEYDHFLRRSAVFVYAIGQDEREDTVVRGKSPCIIVMLFIDTLNAKGICLPNSLPLFYFSIYSINYIGVGKSFPVSLF